MIIHIKNSEGEEEDSLNNNRNFFSIVYDKEEVNSDKQKNE